MLTHNFESSIPAFSSIFDWPDDDLIFFNLYFNIIHNPCLFKNRLWDT
ncbi:hypothetical protein DESC_640003 [Desulfosarcina cetonica]|nr:hypothetical protein DESC_640003 [Desulfosarcina cetonica]